MAFYEQQRYELSHAMRKLRSTLRVVFYMGMARTFGEYAYSAQDVSGQYGYVPYAVYRWRGKVWAVPTDSFNMENHNGL